MAAYATTDQLRIRIQMHSTPTAAQLTMLEELIEGASRSIDRTCHRDDDEFAAPGLAAVKYFTANGKDYIRVPQFLSVDEVAVKTSRTATEFTIWDAESSYLAGDGDWYAAQGDPDNPTFEPPGNLIMVSPTGSYSVFPDGEGAPVIMVTAVWSSLDAVPADIREATLMQAAIWFKQFQGSMSSELGSVDLGTIVYRRGLSSAVKQLLIDGCWVLPLYGGA